MKKITFILDLVFLTFCAFLLYLLIFSYFFAKNVAYSISITLALITAIFLFKFMLNKKKKEIGKNSLNQKHQEAFWQFKFMSKIKVQELFISAFTKHGYTAKKQGKYIEIKEKNLLVGLFLGFEKVSNLEVVRIYNNLNKNQTAVIIASAYEDGALSFIERFSGKIVAKDFNFGASILEKVNLLPKKSVNILPENFKKKSNLSVIFYKKHAKRFFFFGLYFLLFSFFASLKIYYIILGGIFILFAFIIKLFGKNIDEKNLI